MNTQDLIDKCTTRLSKGELDLNTQYLLQAVIGHLHEMESHCKNWQIAVGNLSAELLIYQDRIDEARELAADWYYSEFVCQAPDKMDAWKEKVAEKYPWLEEYRQLLIEHPKGVGPLIDV